MSHTEFALRRETEAARDLLSAIRDQAGGDAELMADSIEGETQLHDAIGAAIDLLDECDMIEAGCDAKIEQIETRKVLAVKRRERVRAAIEQALVTLDLPSLKLATATISIAKRKPAVVIDSEAGIPARFFIEQEPPAPKLDKKALADALAQGAVEGAHLDNGSVTLTIRRN